MIEIFIFHLHIIGALYAFTKNWQSKGIKEGLLAVALIALVFTIGWALTGTIAHTVYPSEYDTIYFNRDILGLILLLIPESVFFYYFFVRDK